MNKKILFLLLIFILVPLTISAEGEAQRLISDINGILTTIAIVLVTIGWTIAGILWLTSGGNPTKTTLAKQALMAAIFGTIAVVLASSAASIISSLFPSVSPFR